MRRLRKVVCRLLCLVMVTSAVACTGEKGASGQKVTVPEVQQEKTVVTHGKHREKSGSSPDSAPDEVVVENNALSVKQNQDRAKEMTQCQGDACSAVIEKYKKINAEQHESVVNCSGAQDCVDKANEVGKLQADYANRTNELLEKARADGGLSPAEQNELSILQVTTIQLEADRNAAIHNALMSGDSPERSSLLSIR